MASVLRTTVAMSHVVPAPVLTEASGVWGPVRTVSSARISMSPAGELLARTL